MLVEEYLSHLTNIMRTRYPNMQNRNTTMGTKSKMMFSGFWKCLGKKEREKENEKLDMNYKLIVDLPL